MERLSDETLEKIFSRLKPYCVDLLDLLRNPSKNPSFLTEMANFLRRAPPEGLQPSVDYTMFPLLLILDAAVRCRSADKGGGSSGGAAIPVIGDSVAEGVLMCLEELLKKCHLGSVNQMVVVLKKLTSGALLSPTEAAEEFREGIIRCLRALLFRIQPCSMVSCSCRRITTPTIISSLQAQYSTSLKYYHEPEECLLAFLQSQNASAAVGHWLSLLLQIAESEVARGHRGSSNLRKEAFLTLRVLVAKIGSADALAFFLPGTVSRFTKALHVSKGIVSGAAGNTGSIEHAVLGLTEFLMIVLSDQMNLHSVEMSTDNTTVLMPKESESTESVLNALRQLPLNAHYHSENSEQSSTHQGVAVISCNNAVEEKNNGYPIGNKTLSVHRTKEWVDRTSEQVDKLLSATFPHLSSHPSEKVRKGLVDGIRGLLTYCCYTLKRSKLMLLECLCVLICDDSVAVSIAAQESLESLFVLGEKFLTENEVSELFTSHIERLPRVVLGSEEAVAIAHARRLLALMYYAGPELVFNHLLSSPIKAGRFLEFLGLSLSHNSQFAGSFDKLISSKPLSIGYLLSVSELKAGTLDGNASNVIGNGAPPVVTEMSDPRDMGLQDSVHNIDSGFELPHMPPWFLNVGSRKLYEALAGILRLSGLSIMAGQKSDLSLSSLIDILLDYFHKLISELRVKEYYKEGWQTWYTRSGSGQLLRQTSSAVCMLNEIIYGLSDQSVSLYSRLFRKTWEKIEERRAQHIPCDGDQCSGFSYNGSAWKVHQGNDARIHIIHCIGSILHEYMSPEVWELPVDQKSTLLDHAADSNLSLHFLRDATTLHQVIIEGMRVVSSELEVLGRHQHPHLTIPFLKGTRDFGKDQMSIRERAFSIITNVFKMHGAVGLDTPVFELRETLMGKYGEDSKLIYDLADQGGELCSLRYDLTVPFARYLAMNNISALKRYQIAKVYRRDNPSKGRYREFYQCDFDIAGQYKTMEPDFEVVKVLTELLDGLNIGDYEIKLNHRKLLDGMLEICGVSSEKFRTVCSSIDKLDKQSFEQIKRELVEEKGLAIETAERIGTLVKKRGPPLEILTELKSRDSQFLENSGSVLALNELDILFRALEKAKCLDKVVFDLSLARGLDYYTGIIYEAVFKGSTQVGSIAAGGRYDNLVGIFSGKQVPAVGVSLGIERVFTIMEQLEKEQNQVTRATETQVLVACLGDDLLVAAELVSELWAAKIKAEFGLTTRVMNHIKRAKESGIPWMVIVGESELKAGIVKLKNIEAKEEVEVPREEIVAHIQRRLNIS